MNLISKLAWLTSWWSVVSSSSCPFKVAEHHDYEALTSHLVCLNKTYSENAHLYSIGQSSQSREMWVLSVSKSKPAEVTPGRAEIKYVANMVLADERNPGPSNPLIIEGKMNN